MPRYIDVFVNDYTQLIGALQDIETGLSRLKTLHRELLDTITGFDVPVRNAAAISAIDTMREHRDVLRGALDPVLKTYLPRLRRSFASLRQEFLAQNGRAELQKFIQLLVAIGGYIVHLRSVSSFIDYAVERSDVAAREALKHQAYSSDDGTFAENFLFTIVAELEKKLPGMIVKSETLFGTIKSVKKEYAQVFNPKNWIVFDVAEKTPYTVRGTTGEDVPVPADSTIIDASFIKKCESFLGTRPFLDVQIPCLRNGQRIQQGTRILPDRAREELTHVQRSSRNRLVRSGTLTYFEQNLGFQMMPILIPPNLAQDIIAAWMKTPKGQDASPAEQRRFLNETADAQILSFCLQNLGQNILVLANDKDIRITLEELQAKYRNLRTRVMELLDNQKLDVA